MGSSAAMHGLLALFVALLTSVSARQCFEVLPELKDLVDAAGESYPIGLWVNDWVAGYLTATVVQILIREKLGYNVELKGPGILTMDGFYAVAGCTSPTAVGNRGCGPSKTYVHINVEVWTSVYAAAWDDLHKNYPAMAPKNLGFMGYYGTTSMYLPSAVQERAYNEEGLHLDFYRDYNASRETPARHFANPGDITVAHLRPCNDTSLMDNQVMTEYVNITSDWGGVDGTPGNLIGRCYENYFWLAPGCRADPSLCLVYLTGGNGWGLWETLVKATSYNMPLATAVASNSSSYSLLPTLYSTLFYWWVPDPRFLRLSPVRLIFPEHNPDEWDKGNRRSAARDVSVEKHVSQDLKNLAPEVEEFMTRLSISIDKVNALMLNQMDTGDSDFDVTCRWLKNNEAEWSEWLPEKGKCFSQFGMYNERMQSFLLQRDDSTGISCRACPSGFFSSRLDDSQGITHVCRPCASGFFQASGASVSCEPCPSGSYQNETASVSCKRCPAGTYQNETGMPNCKVCPGGTNTQLLGSVSISDCGCNVGSIEVSGGSGSTCVPCSAGLDCPFSSTVNNLKRGQSADGTEFVPRIEAGYYATVEEPTEILRCRPEGSCPGGTPGSCSHGLVGPLCAVCAEGQAQSLASTECADCGAIPILLGLLVPVMMAVIVVAYYFTNLEVLTQGTPFKSGLMATAIAVSALQSMAIFGLMSVRWSYTFANVSSGMQIILLDLDAFGLSCALGPNPLTRYLLSVAIFPAAVLWLFLVYRASNLSVVTRIFGRCHRCQGYKPWKLHFAINTAGLGLQMGYGTMAAVAMKPLMCYQHPNGLESMIVYPNLFCGDKDHIYMQIAGMCFLSIFVVGFFVCCAYAAWNIPKWCADIRNERVQSFRFFMSNFRFDAYWFILLVLLRGLGFTLAIVIGTNIPAAQTTLASVVLTIYCILQSMMRPWKVPMINLTDMIVNAALLLLVNRSVPVYERKGELFAETMSIFLLLLILGVISLAAALSALALLVQKTGGKWRPILTLGSVGDSDEIAEAVTACAADLLKIEKTNLAMKIDEANSYDVRVLLDFVDLVGEMLNNPTNRKNFESVKLSRINASVMNRRSVSIVPGYEIDAHRTSVGHEDTSVTVSEDQEDDQVVEERVECEESPMRTKQVTAL